MSRVLDPLEPELWGRDLRYAALAILCLARRPLSVGDIATALAGAGFDPVAGKTLADALGHEVGRGRVARVSRGRYAEGAIPRRTRARILARWRRSVPLRHT